MALRASSQRPKADVSVLDKIDFFGRSSLPAIIQSEAAECGLACLAMVATYHGYKTDLVSLRRRLSISMKGTTLRDVLGMAQRLGMTGRGLRLEPEQLKSIRTPCILHWDMNHFVVLKAVRGRDVIIHDPASGARTYSLAEVANRFTGIALELTPTAAFERKKDVSKLSLTSLWGRLSGLKRALAQALLLSSVLQVVALASPFYMQLVVDDAVMKGDQSLLTVLAVGFALLLLINVGTTWLRSQVLMFLGNALSFQMSAKLFHHLVRLPLEWFEKRHIGDVVSRFRATEPIQKLITQGLIGAIVDGAMAVMTLAMILVYSPTLSLVVFGALALYAASRGLSYHVFRRIQEEAIEAAAKENTSFIETVQAVQSIKIFGREADREALWQNRHADTMNRDIRQARMSLTFTTANQLLYGLENVLVVYLGARAVMAGDLSIGMLYAFMSYKEQFLGKATSLIEMAIEYRMLDLYVSRLSDIALSERESGHDGSGLIDWEIKGGIELRDIVYSYAETEPDVLNGVNLTIEPGEFVAITGPSGGGKTTLLKIMLGLFRPRKGSVLIDGVPLDHIGLQAFRGQVGVVMQDDQLLSGSIAENLCFFDTKIDVEWMRQCATWAGIDDEIMAMPMNYNTLIGDMGTALSGGQRQRVLLARALYRKPRILFMDEGTSNLDVEKERLINRALSALDITRVVIAHRPETVRAANRILVLHDGQVSTMAGPNAFVLGAQSVG
jgi:ATP-binding cassette subfamily B protein RaxB